MVRGRQSGNFQSQGQFENLNSIYLLLKEKPLTVKELSVFCWLSIIEIYGLIESLKDAKSVWGTSKGIYTCNRDLKIDKEGRCNE